MKIHLQSDVHVERGSYLTPSCISDLTICAGDIGCIHDLSQLERYFDKIRKTTGEIIWVLANHEFYHHDYGQALREAHEFALANDIHLLDEALGTENLELDGIKFWGSTLWTDLKEQDWFVMQKIGHGMNDFHIIGYEDKKPGAGFTAHDSVEINKRTREKINWDADIVITHHHPLLRKHKRFPLDDITYGFCNTGLEQQIIDSNVKYWIFGHTHDSTYEDLNGTHVVSNQHGYALQSRFSAASEVTYEDAGYDPKLILEI
jgi:Icc-related predicted phosphoesterase